MKDESEQGLTLQAVVDKLAELSPSHGNMEELRQALFRMEGDWKDVALRVDELESQLVEKVAIERDQNLSSASGRSQNQELAIDIDGRDG
eukprot:5271681-Amphidinium_carterae.2